MVSSILVHNTFNYVSLTCNLLTADYNAEKHRQLHIILAIIGSVFSAWVFILVAYLLIFPASYPEVDTRNREPDSSSPEEKTTTVSGPGQEETKVKPQNLSLQPLNYLVTCNM